jgi:acyl carrier protein
VDRLRPIEVATHFETYPRGPKGMKKSREEILTDVVLLLRTLADDWDDWEYGDEITEETCLLTDMGLESLGVVVLGTAVQEHYKQVLPFPELFAEIGQRERRDISVGEWVDFIYKHLEESALRKPEDAAKS